MDRRESTLSEAGDFLIAKGEGAIGDDHIVGEIGDVLLGRVEGRQTLEDMTLFKSLGIGIEERFPIQRSLNCLVGLCYVHRF